MPRPSDDFLRELGELDQLLKRGQRMMRSLHDLSVYEELHPDVTRRLHNKGSVLGHTSDSLAELPAMAGVGK